MAGRGLYLGRMSDPLENPSRAGLRAKLFSVYLFQFQGICFIRTSRPENAIIYSNNEDFQVGQAKVSVFHV